MRVFIGIKANQELQEKIFNWQEVRKDLSVRFIKPENLHITLIPPWYEKKINHLVNYLNSFITTLSPFELTFNRILFAPSDRPRLIWTEGIYSPPMKKLRSELEKHLKTRKERRQLIPHITIARFKNGDFSSLKNNLETEEIKWFMKVSIITLFESRLGPKGADYFAIEDFKI